MLGKKALRGGLAIGQNVLEGKNLKESISKGGKQAIGLTSQVSLQAQSGAGKKATKRKAKPSKISSPLRKKAKTSPQQKKLEEKFSFLLSK